MKAELKHGLGKGAKMTGGLISLWRNRGRTNDVKMLIVESIFVPTATHGSESDVWNAGMRRWMEVFGMKYLKKILELGVMQRTRNLFIRERCGDSRLKYPKSIWS